MKEELLRKWVRNILAERASSSVLTVQPTPDLTTFAKLSTAIIGNSKTVSSDINEIVGAAHVNKGSDVTFNDAMNFAKGETVMATYGDGLASVNIKKLLDFHKQHGKLATLTAVRPPSRFGEINFDGDTVVNFTEKPQVGKGWINGGFFVLEPEVSDYISNDDMPFERYPLETLSSEGQLMAYKHEGFWQPMDTLREKHLLEKLWLDNQAPWKLW